MRVHLIIKAIEEKYSSISFSTDFFNTTNSVYYNLYLWMHKKKGNIDDPNAPETYEKIVDFGVPNTSGWDHLTISGEDIIVSGLTGSHKIITTFEVDPDNGTSDYTGQLIKDGDIVEQFSATAPNNLTVSSDLGNGTYNFKIIYTDSFNITNVEIDASDLLQPISGTFDSGAFTLTATKEFSGTGQMPDIKIIDFLTGLFKLFNLTAFVEDDGTIKVQTLDAFYSAGKTGDDAWVIDEYVDMSKSTVNVSLPYRQIDLKYAGLGTKLALQHEQLSGKGWGTAEYRGGEDEDKVFGS